MTTEHNAGPLHYPEALRLADLLTAIAEDPMWAAHGEISKLAALRIADELRRLYVEVETLKLENNNLHWLSMRMTPDKTVAELFYAREENKRLREANAELLEALRTALDASWNGPMPDYARDEARDAIAKAEEVKP